MLVVMMLCCVIILIVMFLLLLILNDFGWKYVIMFLRFDRVVCIVFLRFLLIMSYRFFVKIGFFDSNRCLDRERNKMMVLFGVILV